MKNNISYIVKKVNHLIETNDIDLISYLKRYLESSYTKTVNTAIGTTYHYYPHNQKKIVGYKTYFDENMQHKHKSNRILVSLIDGEIIDVGVFKFKRFLRRVYK